MFDRDKWIEILTTIIQNPLRTILTGISVASGIFILVVMQGLGFGLQNGVYEMMQDDAINSLFIRSDATSLPYKGLQPNREIVYDNRDLEEVVSLYEESEVFTGRFGRWSVDMEFADNNANFGMRGVHPGHQEIERTKMKHGRYINESDIEEKRKVCVLGQVVVDDLFEDVNPVGQYMNIASIPFKVIGTYEDPNSRWENRQAMVPISTAQQIYGAGDRLDMFMVSTGDATLEESIEMRKNITTYLQEKHKVHPDDRGAIRVRNNNEEFQEIVGVLMGIKAFIWFIGIMTLFAGVMGVANIMSIVVKERTREIGVRKALGATPNSILSLIILESIFLTFIAGCVGLMFGVFVLNFLVSEVSIDFFKNPQISLKISLICLMVLVFAGSIAGLIPAIRAVRLRPVEALRDA